LAESEPELLLSFLLFGSTFRRWGDWQLQSLRFSPWLLAYHKSMWMSPTPADRTVQSLLFFAHVKN